MSAVEQTSALAYRAEDGREHLLEEQLESVGGLAGAFASKWGAGTFGEIARLLHDLEKYASDFQAYLRAVTLSATECRDAHIEAGAENYGPRRGRGDHSSAGALDTRDLCRPRSEFVAFTVEEHHAALAPSCE